MAAPFVAVRWGETRGFTNGLLEMVEEGVLPAENLLREVLLWMSEHEVQDFCERSLMLRDEDNEPIVRLVEEEEEE